MIAAFMKFTGLSKLGAILGTAALAALAFGGMLLKSNRDGQKKGKAKERAKRNKETRNVKKKMDKVKPATSDDVDDSLSGGTF